MPQILSGRLHIDIPVAFGWRVLLSVLIGITKPHPDLSLMLTFSDVTSDFLQDDVDLAIGFSPLKDSSDLVARRLVTQDRIICASSEYLRMHGGPATLADVRAHRCIEGALNVPPLSWFVSDGGAEKRYTPPSTHRLSDGEAMGVEVHAMLQHLECAGASCPKARAAAGHWVTCREPDR